MITTRISINSELILTVTVDPSRGDLLALNSVFNPEMKHGRIRRLCASIWRKCIAIWKKLTGQREAAQAKDEKLVRAIDFCVGVITAWDLYESRNDFEPMSINQDSFESLPYSL